MIVWDNTLVNKVLEEPESKSTQLILLVATQTINLQVTIEHGVDLATWLSSILQDVLKIMELL